MDASKKPGGRFSLLVFVCALSFATLTDRGIAHSTFAFFAAGHNKALAVVISGGPFLLAGILFLVFWRSAARSRAE